jgi:hypothetical protein
MDTARQCVSSMRIACMQQRQFVHLAVLTACQESAAHNAGNVLRYLVCGGWCFLKSGFCEVLEVHASIPRSV